MSVSTLTAIYSAKRKALQVEFIDDSGERTTVRHFTDVNNTKEAETIIAVELNMDLATSNGQWPAGSPVARLSWDTETYFQLGLDQEIW